MRRKSFFWILSLVLTLLLGSTTVFSTTFATTLEMPPLSVTQPLTTVPLQPVATSVPLSPTASLPYTDVAEHWAKEAILAGSARGFVQGSYGVFRPDTAITRGEMAVIVDRMMGYLVPSASAFFDLDENFYTLPILRAHHAGVLYGDQGLVRPLDPITREEAVVILARALGIAPSTTPIPYTDRDIIADWATPYVQALTEQGILNGREGKFDPQASITRAEVLTILYQSVTAYYDTPGTYEGIVKGHAIIKTDGVHLKDAHITGNLIIAEGVADGTITLEDTTVDGTVWVRGGGAHSIRITGNSSITSVVVDNKNGEVRIYTESGVKVQQLEANEEVILEGQFGQVTVQGDGAKLQVLGSVDHVTIRNAAEVRVAENANVAQVEIEHSQATLLQGSFGTINVKQENATLTIAEASQVQQLNTLPGATSVQIEVQTKATVANMTIEGQENLITGSGKVGKVSAETVDVKVETAGTTVQTPLGTIVTQGEYVPSDDAELQPNGVKINGVTVTDLGKPATNLTDVTPGSVTLYSTDIGSTTFARRDGGATLRRVVKYAAQASTQNFATDTPFQAGTDVIANGDFFVVQILAEDGYTTRYYRINITQYLVYAEPKLTLTAPVKETLSTNAVKTQDETQGYTIVSTVWEETDSATPQLLPQGDSFAGNRTYRATITLEAEPFALFRGVEQVNLTGGTVESVILSPDDTQLTIVTHNFSKTEKYQYTAPNLQVTAPVKKAQAQEVLKSRDETQGFQVISSIWHDTASSATLQVKEIFDGGTAYYLVTVLRAEADYSFSEWDKQGLVFQNATFTDPSSQIIISPDGSQVTLTTDPFAATVPNKTDSTASEVYGLTHVSWASDGSNPIEPSYALLDYNKLGGSINSSTIIANDTDATMRFYGTDASFTSEETGNIENKLGQDFYFSITAEDRSVRYYQVALRKVYTSLQLSITAPVKLVNSQAAVKAATETQDLGAMTTTWYNTSIKPMEELTLGQPFAVNRAYKAVITVQAMGHGTFVNLSTVQVENAEVLQVVKNLEQTEVTITTTSFPATEKIYYEAPQLELLAAPVKKVTSQGVSRVAQDTQNYTLSDVAWFYGTNLSQRLEVGGVFDGGISYAMQIHLQAAEDHSFANIDKTQLNIINANLSDPANQIQISGEGAILTLTTDPFAATEANKTDASLLSFFGFTDLIWSSGGSAATPFTTTIRFKDDRTLFKPEDIVKNDADATLTYYGSDATYSQVSAEEFNFTLGETHSIYFTVTAEDRQTSYYHVQLNKYAAAAIGEVYYERLTSAINVSNTSGPTTIRLLGDNQIIPLEMDYFLRGEVTFELGNNILNLDGHILRTDGYTLNLRSTGGYVAKGENGVILVSAGNVLTWKGLPAEHDLPGVLSLPLGAQVSLSRVTEEDVNESIIYSSAGQALEDMNTKIEQEQIYSIVDIHASGIGLDRNITFSSGATLRTNGNLFSPNTYNLVVPADATVQIEGTIATNHTGKVLVEPNSKLVGTFNMDAVDSNTATCYLKGGEEYTFFANLDEIISGDSMGNNINLLGVGKTVALSKDLVLPRDVTLNLRNNTLVLNDFDIVVGDYTLTIVSSGGTVAQGSGSGKILIGLNSKLNTELNLTTVLEYDASIAALVTYANGQQTYFSDLDTAYTQAMSGTGGNTLKLISDASGTLHKDFNVTLPVTIDLNFKAWNLGGYTISIAKSKTLTLQGGGSVVAGSGTIKPNFNSEIVTDLSLDESLFDYSLVKASNKLGDTTFYTEKIYGAFAYTPDNTIITILRNGENLILESSVNIYGKTTFNIGSNTLDMDDRNFVIYPDAVLNIQHTSGSIVATHQYQEGYAIFRDEGGGGLVTSLSSSVIANILHPDVSAVWTRQSNGETHYYTTIQRALNHISTTESGSLLLMKNVTLPVNNGVTLPETTILDLNGKTFYLDDYSSLMVEKGANIQANGGKLRPSLVGRAAMGVKLVSMDRVDLLSLVDLSSTDFVWSALENDGTTSYKVYRFGSAAYFGSIQATDPHKVGANLSEKRLSVARPRVALTDGEYVNPRLNFVPGDNFFSMLPGTSLYFLYGESYIIGKDSQGNPATLGTDDRTEFGTFQEYTTYGGIGTGAFVVYNYKDNYFAIQNYLDNDQGIRIETVSTAPETGASNGVLYLMANARYIITIDGYQVHFQVYSYD